MTDDATLEVSRHAVVYVLVPVEALDELGAPADPTALTVRMAFSSSQALGDAPTWHAASWQTDTSTDPDTRYVRCKVGPGSGVGQLAAGIWWPFVEVQDGANETPVLRAGVPIRVV